MKFNFLKLKPYLENLPTEYLNLALALVFLSYTFNNVVVAFLLTLLSLLVLVLSLSKYFISPKRLQDDLNNPEKAPILAAVPMYFSLALYFIPGNYTEVIFLIISLLYTVYFSFLHLFKPGLNKVVNLYWYYVYSGFAVYFVNTWSLTTKLGNVLLGILAVLGFAMVSFLMFNGKKKEYFLSEEFAEEAIFMTGALGLGLIGIVRINNIFFQILAFITFFLLLALYLFSLYLFIRKSLAKGVFKHLQESIDVVFMIAFSGYMSYLTTYAFYQKDIFNFLEKTGQFFNLFGVILSIMIVLIIVLKESHDFPKGVFEKSSMETLTMEEEMNINSVKDDTNKDEKKDEEIKDGDFFERLSDYESKKDKVDNDEKEDDVSDSFKSYMEYKNRKMNEYNKHHSESSMDSDISKNENSDSSVEEDNH